MNFNPAIQNVNSVETLNPTPVSPQISDNQIIIKVIQSMRNNVEQLHAALMYMCGEKNQKGITDFITAVDTENHHLAENFADDSENYKAIFQKFSQEIISILFDHLPQNDQQGIVDVINQLTTSENNDDVESAKMVLLAHLRGRSEEEFNSNFQIEQFQLTLNDPNETYSMQIISSVAKEQPNGGPLQINKNNLNNNFILLHNHIDIGLIDLIENNKSWVMNTFDAIYVECCPKHFDRAQILNFLFSNYLTQVVKVSSVAKQCALTTDEVDALQFCEQDYSVNPLLHDKILMGKLTGLEKVCAHLQSTNPLQQNGATLTQLLFGLKLAILYKACTENTNIKLIGVEPENYQTGALSINVRDKSMSQSLYKNNCRSRNALFIVGANHGVGLMNDLCSSGRGGFHFVRLTVNKNTYSEQSNFIQWCNINRNNNSGYSERPSYATSFAMKQISNGAAPELQAQELISLYKPYKGLVPIPLDNKKLS